MRGGSPVEGWGGHFPIVLLPQPQAWHKALFFSESLGTRQMGSPCLP